MRTSPELAIAHKRSQQAEISRKLAEKEFYPDLKIVGRFDTMASHFWAPDRVSLRPQLGVYLDPPVQQARRWARLRETELTKRRREAEARSIQTALRDDIRRVLADLERTENRIARLDRLVAAARRRAETRETLVSSGFGDHDRVSARRTVLKYEQQRLRQQGERLLRLNDLADLVGDDTWSGHDPADEAGAWRSSIQFLPQPANELMDALRAGQR